MSGLSTVYKYQYDDTGVSPTNLIANESRTFIASDPSVFVPNEGLFYGDSLVITNGGTTLTKGIDYDLEVLDAHFTAATGKAVYAGVKRLSAAMLGTISVTYQCLGGPEGEANSFVLALKEAIDNAVANPTVVWADIQGKPSAFTPAMHRHYPSDLEDLDLLAQKFDDFVDAIVSVRFYKDSNHSLHNEILRLTALAGSLRNSINSISAMTGSVSDILALQNRLDNIAQEVSGNFPSVVSGTTAEVYSKPLADFDSISLAFSAASATYSLTFNIIIVKTGATVRYSVVNNLGTGGLTDDLNFIDFNSSEFLVSDTGPNLTINVTPTSDMAIKVKELYVL